jgi:glycine dehydrogenase subunit 1
MNASRTTAHPYMANSAPSLRQELLDAVGVADVDELFEQIPHSHRLARPLDLPPALSSEIALARHLRTTLAANGSCEEYLSFLGGGCWQHHVPAVCDEIAQRTEFVTSEWGTPASDLGRNQAWFEFASQLGELLELDFVGLPVYSWGCAAGHAIRMAARINGREGEARAGGARVIVPELLDSERAAVIATYCGLPEDPDHVTVVPVAVDGASGGLDLVALRNALAVEPVAAVYVEHPTSLGALESSVAEIVEIAHAAGALVIAGGDPIALGVLAPPGAWGADIAVGPTQPLGVHMYGGGGCGGFIATPDEERFARQYPTLQVSLAPTGVAGEHGFAMALFEQSSYGRRELGNDWTGNSVYLWAIVNATYMSLLGPDGFAELGEAILARSHYAAQRLATLPGVTVRFPAFFKELVIDLTATGRTVAEINRALRTKHGIYGGGDLSASHPELGQCALYCVTEIHEREDIDRLVDALSEVLA